MKRILLLLLLLASSCSGLQAQRTTLRTNLLFWGTTTPNAGVEFSLGRNFTLVLDGGYNAWEFSNDMKLNLAFAQPEIRYCSVVVSKVISSACTDTTPISISGRLISSLV